MFGLSCNGQRRLTVSVACDSSSNQNRMGNDFGSLVKIEIKYALGDLIITSSTLRILRLGGTSSDLHSFSIVSHSVSEIVFSVR